MTFSTAPHSLQLCLCLAVLFCSVSWCRDLPFGTRLSTTAKSEQVTAAASAPLSVSTTTAHHHRVAKNSVTKFKRLPLTPIEQLIAAEASHTSGAFHSTSSDHSSSVPEPELVPVTDTVKVLEPLSPTAEVTQTHDSSSEGVSDHSNHAHHQVVALVDRPLVVLEPTEHVINLSQKIESPQSSSLSLALEHAALESGSSSQSGDRRPILVNSQTALSHTYALPPLTAALPVDLLERLAGDLSGHNVATHRMLETPPEVATVPVHQPQPNPHRQHHHHHHHSNPSFSLPGSRSATRVYPIRMTPAAITGHLVHDYDRTDVHSPEPSVSTHHLLESSHPKPKPEPHNSPIISHKPHTHHHHFEPVDHVPGIPGRAWKDYPLFSEVPKTSFTCDASGYGYYADVETGCQVWHYCQPDGRHNSFLCPNGTVFNQRVRVCDWWYNVHCASSVRLYGMNADLYKQPTHFGNYVLGKQPIPVVGEPKLLLHKNVHHTQPHAHSSVTGLVLSDGSLVEPIHYESTKLVEVRHSGGEETAVIESDKKR